MKRNVIAACFAVLSFLCAAQTVSLPSWTRSAGAPLAFIDGKGASLSAVDATAARCRLEGFIGTATGVRTDGDRVILDNFELEPPMGGNFKGGGPVFRLLGIGPRGLSSPAISACGNRIMKDGLGRDFRSGYVRLAWGEYTFDMTEVSLEKGAFAIKKGSVVLAADSGDCLSGAVDGLTFGPGWAPIKGRNSITVHWIEFAFREGVSIDSKSVFTADKARIEIDADGSLSIALENVRMLPETGDPSADVLMNHLDFPIRGDINPFPDPSS